MELRSQKATGFVVAALLWLAPGLWSQEYEFQVRHDHWRKACRGVLRMDSRGVTFTATDKDKKHPHAWEWAWQDIQQLDLSPRKLRVLTYKDNAWKLGADREYEFYAAAGKGFDEVYPLLKDRLDQRFVAVLADDQVAPLWKMPVKRLGRIRGSEGVLEVAADRIVYNTSKKDQSRTWRFRDIDNISTSGPFQLTLTTFERSKLEYGSRKGFNFQLKQPLDEKRFNLLWRQLNQAKGLEFLKSV
jgi:hypothetical protein